MGVAKVEPAAVPHRSTHPRCRERVQVCSDGLGGMTDAVEQVWPQGVHQQCVVHLVRAVCATPTARTGEKVTSALRDICTAPEDRFGVRR
ncbi:transposase [Micromonospora sp. ATCC 39149]|nr:transposase [Micromonospora sp. ATCC 39149]